MNNHTEQLARLGITSLSEMQEQAGACIRQNPSVVLLAPTGTGKTLAFLLPLMEWTEIDKPEIQSLILSPTRELALQTYGVLKAMKPGLRTVCLHGGRPAMEEHRTLREMKPQIVVATPGRMCDHIDKGNVTMDEVRTLVIDEYDKMLELGFQDEMEHLTDHLHHLEHSILVSATRLEEMPPFMTCHGPMPVCLDYINAPAIVAAPAITHYQVRSPEPDKLETLSQLLSKLEGHPAVVFLNYREAVDRVGHYLHEQGFSCETFHGGLEQPRREAALGKFRNGSANVLVSTDLSARGLDIPTLDCVIHYHLPIDADGYLHRSGRTGRWEAEGRSYIILGPNEDPPHYDGITFESLTLLPPYPKPVEPAWVTLYIGKGKKDKLSKTDVVGFLCKKGGLKSSDIGNIDLRDHYIYAAIKRNKLSSLLRLISGEKIKGLRTILQVMKDKA